MRAETLHAADHRARHRAVHHRGRLRRCPGLDAHHDALPRDSSPSWWCGTSSAGCTARSCSAAHYIMPSILRGPRPGHQGPAARRRVEGTHRGEPAQRGPDPAPWTPTSSSRSCCAGSTRSCPSRARPSPVSPDEMFDDIKVPTLIIRGGENDWDHPKRTSLEVSCLIKGSKLIDPPWPEDAWERAGEKFAPAARSSASTCSTRGCRPRPPILDFLGK